MTTPFVFRSGNFFVNFERTLHNDVVFVSFTLDSHFVVKQNMITFTTDRYTRRDFLHMTLPTNFLAENSML